MSLQDYRGFGMAENDRQKEIRKQLVREREEFIEEVDDALVTHRPNAFEAYSELDLWGKFWVWVSLFIFYLMFVRPWIGIIRWLIS